MTSVASRPSYQSIQWGPAGWALRHPERSYHRPCIRTSNEVRQNSSLHAGTSTHSASSSHSHAVGGSETTLTTPSVVFGRSRVEKCAVDDGIIAGLVIL